MRKYILLLALSVLMSAAGFSAYAQNLVKVKGVVTSQDDGLPLIGVAVMAGPGGHIVGCNIGRGTTGRPQAVGEAAGQIQQHLRHEIAGVA